MSHDVRWIQRFDNLERAYLTLSGILNDESPLPYEFDIIDYDTLEHQKLKEHIDRVGKIIYTR